MAVGGGATTTSSCEEKLCYLSEEETFFIKYDKTSMYISRNFVFIDEGAAVVFGVW